MRIRPIAEMVAIDCDKINPHGKNQARRAFVDTIGVCFPAIDETIYDVLRRYCDTLSAGDVPTPFCGKKLTSRDAAVMWGAVSHAIDFDDSCPALNGHPSVVLLPAVMAAGAAYGRSGKEALDAYICGFEAMNRMAVCATIPQYKVGWHTTTTVGIFGAVVAACRLIGCTVEQTEQAMGIAASMAAGIQANFGSMTKPLHPGFTAANAITAAEMAKLGITSSPKAFNDGGLSYFACYGGKYTEVPAERRFIEEGITVKPYPSCGCTTRANDIAVSVYKQGIRPEDIESIACKICTIDENCLSYHRPQLGSEAKFSLEYGIAKCLLNGGVRLSDFTDENVKLAMADRKMRSLIEKISYTVPEELKDRPFYQAHMDQIYKLKDGRTIELHVENPKGFPSNPMTDEEVRLKFMDCLSTHVDSVRSAALYDTLIHVDEQTAIKAVMQDISDLMK